MNERLRLLRDELNLSRAAFGQRIGVSGDVVNNLERGRVEIKEHIIKLICTEFSANEEWLRTGDGPIFVEPDTFSLDLFVEKHGMTGFELDVIKAYFELDPEIRKAVVSHFKNRLAARSKEPEDLRADCPSTPEELERQFPPVESSNSEVG
ncbi:helix-turn-helix transcriptional regulator [Bacteroides sp.]|uniref:helix-turn-helix domain-containing protein n=1 Tax=Bacteroides sp. TaxID=29523 RepID=UPI00261B89C1|nr:helix-turn-helix transcriptional regulator [Bacteroides sp.]MDD3041277.1 helix-turn-helix transcriptional regulator [Bacteroides sp.]